MGSCINDTEGDERGLVHVRVAARAVTKGLLRRMLERSAEAEAPAQVSSVGSGSNDARAGNSDGAAVRDSAKGPSVSPARLRDDTTGRGVAVVAKGDGK